MQRQAPLAVRDNQGRAPIRVVLRTVKMRPASSILLYIVGKLLPGKAPEQVLELVQVLDMRQGNNRTVLMHDGYSARSLYQQGMIAEGKAADHLHQPLQGTRINIIVFKGVITCIAICFCDHLLFGQGNGYDTQIPAGIRRCLLPFLPGMDIIACPEVHQIDHIFFFRQS